MRYAYTAIIAAAARNAIMAAKARRGVSFVASWASLFSPHKLCLQVFWQSGTDVQDLISTLRYRNGIVRGSRLHDTGLRPTRGPRSCHSRRDQPTARMCMRVAVSQGEWTSALAPRISARALGKVGSAWSRLAR